MAASYECSAAELAAANWWKYFSPASKKCPALLRRHIPERCLQNRCCARSSLCSARKNPLRPRETNRRPSANATYEIQSRLYPERPKHTELYTASIAPIG